MTNEPPDGVQQSLMRLYSSEPLNDEQFYKGKNFSDIFSEMMESFGLYSLKIYFFAIPNFLPTEK